MADNVHDLEELVLTRLLRLNAKIQGLSVGIIAGLTIFLATNWLLIRGGKVVGPHLGLLGQYFIGYRVSFVGSLIGFIYAFALGFLIGYGVAVIYNGIVERRDRTSLGHTHP